MGAQHCPLGLHALRGLRAAGVGGGRPWGGVACHRCEGRLVSGAVPPPAACALGQAAGVRDPCVPGAVGAGVGTQHRPHSVRPCGLALLAVGVAEGRRRGAAFHRCEGRLRSGAPPPPTARPLGGLLGSATHVLWARVCGCRGPTLSPWPACPVGAACRGGGGGPSPGGVACHHCEGRLVSGAVPPPAARPLGRAAWFLRPMCPGCGRCGRGDAAPAPRRAPLRAGVARRGGCGRASPGGVPFAVVRGVWGQALPLPRLPALWAGCRGPLPTCCGRGCAGVGALHRPRGPRALWGAVRHGVWRGASRFRRPLFPAARPLGGLPGPAGHVLWARVLVCAVCVVSVRCVSWCVVPPFSCPSGAPLSGASVRCGARRVPCACRAPSPARVPCSAAGYPLFLPSLFTLSSARPSPWHALFPCLRPGVCLCLFLRRLVFLPRCAL